MKIYTKKGDDGTTGLIGGTRVLKNHVRIEAYGTVDELNSWMGFLGDQGPAASQLGFIRKIQNDLFTIGSHLASDPEKSKMKLPEISSEDVKALENSMDEMEKELPELKNFVLPGGHSANSAAHIARTICRRAERCIVHLNEISALEPMLIQYLNRLSDWLFMFARFVSKETGTEEIVWKP